MKKVEITELLTIPAVARAVGLGIKPIKYMVETGAIPSKVVGKRRLIDRRWLEAWLNENAQRGVSAGKSAA